MVESIRPMKALQHPRYQQAILIAASLVALLAIAFVLARAGYLRTMVTGEALYDFGYPASYSFSESIREFFTDRVQARYLHGVLVTLVYKVFRFNPPMFYFSALALLAAAAAGITWLLREYLKPGWRSAMLLLAVATLPVVVPILVSLKKLHHALAWALFWWACVCLYQWARSRAHGWGLAAAALFIGAWLSYEAIAFLLPVGLFLAAAWLKGWRQFAGYFLAAMLITVAAYYVSGALVAHYEVYAPRTVSLEPLAVLLAPLRSIIAMLGFIANGAHIGSYDVSPLTQLFARVSMLALIGFGLGHVALAIARQRAAVLQDKWFWLSVTGLWLSFFTYIPFSLIEQRPDGDSLMGVGYGCIFLLVSAVHMLSARFGAKLGSLVFAAMLLASALVGVFSHQSQVATLREYDRGFEQFLRSLQAQAPSVQDDSTFVLVNTSWGRTGCLGYMNMLYLRNNLWCIHLLDGDREEMYTHAADGTLVEDTGRVFQPYFIIIQQQLDGNVKILDALRPGDFPLIPLEWQNPQPVYTDYSRILPEETGKSELMQYLDTLP